MLCQAVLFFNKKVKISICEDACPSEVSSPVLLHTHVTLETLPSPLPMVCDASTQEEPSTSWADRMDDLDATEIDPS